MARLLRSKVNIAVLSVQHTGSYYSLISACSKQYLSCIFYLLMKACRGIVQYKSALFGDYGPASAQEGMHMMRTIG